MCGLVEGLEFELVDGLNISAWDCSRFSACKAGAPRQTNREQDRRRVKSERPSEGTIGSVDGSDR